MRSSRTCAGMMKHSDAAMRVHISKRPIGIEELMVVMLLYNIDPSIMEHIRIANMSPKGRSREYIS